MLGYQLLSAYKEASADLRGTLEKIKAMGYDGVEFIGFFGHDPKEVKAMLDEIGLVGMSVLMPFSALKGNIYKAVSDCKQAGFQYISILLMDDKLLPGGEGFGQTIRDIMRMGEVVKAAGMQLIYHNHGYEFSEISGQLALDFIHSAIPEDLLQPELDCYWVKYAGQDPVKFIEKYVGRCDIVHLKDYVGLKEGAAADPEHPDTPFAFKPVGHGWQDTPSTVEAGLKAGTKWFIVEQDASVENTSLEDAKLSLEYLRKLGL